MGGVPVLLMIAAIGITYGWQPDSSGGVEYVIQIPPDQLHELERIGEVSSAIDPAVQGHVSRVIIRVGNSSLPRITPPGLARRSELPSRNGGVMVVSDQSPVPIPEMDQRSQAMPIPNLGSNAFDAVAQAGQSDHAAVMKPDTNDPRNGPGFSFPSVPSSLRDTAAGATDGIRRDIDRAGREIGTRTTQEIDSLLGQAGASLRNPAADAVSGIRVPPPATRIPNVNTQPQAPQFTGSDPTGEFARTRAGGPSTEPTNTRDNSWRDFTGREAVGTSGVNASNPFDSRTANTQGNSIARQPTANGLSTSDTFGKAPSGLTLPSTADPRAATYADRNSNASTGAYPQAGYPPAVYSQTQQSQLDRQSQYSSDPRASAGTYGQTANAYNPLSSAERQRSTAAQNNSNPNSGLTAAEIAAGAWTVDIYGRPLDREGRLLGATTQPNQSVATYDQARIQNERYMGQSSSSLGQPNAYPPPYANPPASNFQTQPQQMSNGYPAPAPANTNFARDAISSNRDDGMSRSDMVRRDVSTTQTQLDAGLLADRRVASAGVGAGNRQPDASQPLFNFLLLISFVANVYLVFWLKNLRLQFRDMVAAKRVANANSVAA